MIEHGEGLALTLKAQSGRIGEGLNAAPAV